MSARTRLALFPRVRAIHAWAGLVLAMVLAVLSVSGVLLIFKDDYLRLVYPASQAELVADPLLIGASIEAIEREFGSDNLVYVSLARPTFALHRVVLHSGERAYVNQAGTVIERWQRNDRFEDWLFHLHHYLFLGDAGKYLAGTVALAAVPMVASGLYLVLPFLRRFAWRGWPRSTSRRDLLAYHRNTGVIFATPMVLLLLTGAAMVFYSQTSAVLLAVTNSERTLFETPVASTGDVNWELALSRSMAVFSDATPRLVIWPRSDSAPASIRLRRAAEWHQNGRTYAYIDPQSSTVLATRDAMALSVGERAVNTVYPLHSTGIGGRIYDALLASAGLAMTIMTVIGALSYVNLIRQRRRNNTAPTATEKTR